MLLRVLPAQGLKAMLAVALGALVINALLAACVYRLVMPRDIDVIARRVTQFVEFVQLVPAAREFDVAQTQTLPPPPPMPQRAPMRTVTAASAPSAAAAAAATESSVATAAPAVALPAVSASAVLDQVLAQAAPAAGGKDGAAGVGGGDGQGESAAGANTLQLRADDIEINLAPSYRLSPSYPLRALKEGIEGVVTVEFMIDSQGNVREPHILHAEPPALFDDAVMNALPKWKFSPKLVNGQSVPRRARQDVVFRLHRQ